MGAWGDGPFENDDAGDWVYDLEKTTDASLLRSTLESGTGDDYLEAPDGANAIAAAEVVAAAMGRPAPSLPDEVTAWVAANAATVTPDVVDLARRAVDRVVADDSELRELWDEAGSDEWLRLTADLRSRLG